MFVSPAHSLGLRAAHSTVARRAPEPRLHGCLSPISAGVLASVFAGLLACLCGKFGSNPVCICSRGHCAPSPSRSQPLCTQPDAKAAKVLAQRAVSNAAAAPHPDQAGLCQHRSGQPAELGHDVCILGRRSGKPLCCQGLLHVLALTDALCRRSARGHGRADRAPPQQFQRRR